MGNEEKKGEIQFPIPGADSCPSCGSIERTGQKVIRAFKDEGELSGKAFPAETFMLQVTLMDTTRQPLATHFTIPIIQIYFDVCDECKLIYCTGVHLTEQPAEVRQKGPINQPGLERLGGFPFLSKGYG